MRIVVVGAHGKVARHLGQMLVARGDEVTGIIRTATQSDALAADGVDPLVADVERLSVDEIAVHLRGHDAVVWSAGAGGGDPARTRAVDRDAAIRSMDAAAVAAIDRYVMVSYFGSRLDHGVPPEIGFFHYAEAKAAADEHLRASSLDWTVLGPSRLTDAPGRGSVSVDDANAGEVPRADVAAVVAATLVEPSTIGRTIRFNTGAVPIDEAVRYGD